jgi:hypothetical protein
MTELSPEEWGNRYRNVRGTREALTGLKNEFQIDGTNSVDKAAGLDPDRFGYTSIAQLDSYLAGEIFPVSIAGASVFKRTEPVLRTR